MTAPSQLDVPESAPQYLTTSQVARLLQVSEKTVYRWSEKEASMPGLWLGRTVRFPRERLMRWLRNCEQGRGRAEVCDADLALKNSLRDLLATPWRGNGATIESELARC